MFRDYGLPVAIRTDNGAPFASRALGGLTRLAVWWLKLGITPERIAPGQPQQNGRHERMHRTLKAATTQPAAFAQGTKSLATGSGVLPMARSMPLNASGVSSFTV